jgi:hypothetical protein
MSVEGYRYDGQHYPTLDEMNIASWWVIRENKETEGRQATGRICRLSERLSAERSLPVGSGIEPGSTAIFLLTVNRGSARHSTGQTIDVTGVR